MTRLVLFSDTHGQHERVHLPDGDILIFAGDMCITESNDVHEVRSFVSWLNARPHKHKIFIAGNHDFPFEKFPHLMISSSEEVHYLEDSGAELEGLKFWGSPVQPEFMDWAFNRKRGTEILEHWKKIPTDTNVVITHGPPSGILDEAKYNGGRVGCLDLAIELQQRVKPQLHVFGHIHEGAGAMEINETLYVNASVLDERYRLKNNPIVVDLLPR